MKKGICWLLAFLLVFAFFGCGNESDDPNVPDGCKLLSSEALDFSFCYPDEWEPDRTDGMLSVRYNVGTNLTTVYASVSAMAFSLSASDLNMGANNYWDRYKTQLESNFAGIEFLKEKEETNLGGVVANRNRCKYVQDELEICFETVICVRSGYVYLVTLTVPQRNYGDALAGFETIIKTFKFI